MKVPLAKRVRYFIFVAIASIIVSVSINLTIGKVFQPTTPTATSIEMTGFALEKKENYHNIFLAHFWHIIMLNLI